MPIVKNAKDVERGDRVIAYWNGRVLVVPASERVDHVFAVPVDPIPSQTNDDPTIRLAAALAADDAADRRRNDLQFPRKVLSMQARYISPSPSGPGKYLIEIDANLLLALGDVERDFDSKCKANSSMALHAHAINMVENGKTVAHLDKLAEAFEQRRKAA